MLVTEYFKDHRELNSRGARLWYRKSPLGCEFEAGLRQATTFAGSLGRA